MEPDELRKKLRSLEEGQAELKREIGNLMPGPPRPRRRAFRLLLSSSSRRVVARGRLPDRHCHCILQSLGQAVHVISPDGRFLYWNRYAEHMFGYSASEAIGGNAVELIIHPTDFDAAKVVIQNIFRGKCWRGKFPVKKKSGERFFILIHNTPLYDDDGSLVVLIGLSVSSGSAESYPSTAKPQFHANNRPKSGSANKGSLHSQQPLQSATTSKIVSLVTSVTSRVRSRIRTCQNSNKQYGSGCEGQYSELDLQAELASSEENTPTGDVMHCAFVAEEKSPGKSCKTSSDDSGEGKVGFHKILILKAQALLTKKGISWPWKGHEIDGGSGTNNMNSAQLHDKPENDQTHQKVPVLEPIIISGCQNSEYSWASKYEVSGSWWDYSKNNTSSMSSTGSTNSSGIDGVDYEADYLDYEILWEDLVIGEQVGQGCCGTVYHALWHDSDVAAKVFSKQEYSEEMINTFRQEVSLMKKLRHPNIILFMGAVVSQQRLCIVTEFLPRGSLFRLLQNNIGKLDPRRRVNMAIDIARGMNYLHSSTPTVVHRDLKSPNLLVDELDCKGGRLWSFTSETRNISDNKNWKGYTAVDGSRGSTK